jgi:hypothetical protein
MGDIYGAVWDGNEEEVTRLLDADPTLLDWQDGDGNRPLTMAAEHGHLGVVTRYLL